MAEFSVENDFLDDGNEGSDDFRIRPEDFTDLFVIPSDWTVSTLRAELSDVVDLDPDFQRRSVWSSPTKSQFIESLALGIPIPQILLAESQGKRGSYLVLDGKQRLLTIKEFFEGLYSDGKVFKLSGLTDLQELNGLTWAQISQQFPAIARSIDSSLIRTAIIRGWRNDNVLYEIFHRLNSGSVRLSPMELRMSLIRGPFMKEVVALTSVISPLHEVLRLSQPDKRMKDVEVAIRHMAFEDGRVEYRGNLKDFLDDFCRLRNKEYVGGAIQALNELNDGIKLGLNAFGPNLGRKFIPTRKQYEPSFNRAVFDVQAGALVKPEFQKLIQSRPSEVVQLFEEVSANSGFIRAIESTTKTVDATRVRFRTWYSAIEAKFNIKLAMPNIADARN